jgi:hypothetical protein
MTSLDAAKFFIPAGGPQAEILARISRRIGKNVLK